MPKHEHCSHSETCPKCGWDDPWGRFRPEYVHDKAGGRLVKRCRRCGYSWEEDPADAKRSEPNRYSLGYKHTARAVPVRDEAVRNV